MTFNPMHSSVVLGNPEGWVMRISHRPHVSRLVVFVHGFNGRATRTWDDFPDGVHLEEEWWREADMLFVGYDSTRDNITAVASRINRELPRFYPAPNSDALTAGSTTAREFLEPYQELILVGHSLGGLVLRRAMLDAAMRWTQQQPVPHAPDVSKPPILDGTLRLFSPASAGFRAAGVLGLLKATSVWAVVEMFVRRSSAYSDLQPHSTTLADTRRRTELIAHLPGLEGLRATILWANPDDVVLAERYDTDFVDDAYDGKSHSTICKPHIGNYEEPWRFVERGVR